jgi:hypothetical protein
VVKIREYVEAGATVMAPTAGVPTTAGAAENMDKGNNSRIRTVSILFILSPV